MSSTPLPDRTNEPAHREGAGRPSIGALLVGLVVGTALFRVGLAGSKSLVLDEFHTWFHATRTDFAAFFEALCEDNHPPLSFLVVGVARTALGSSELALRSPAIVYGLVEIALVAALARRLAGPRASVVAAALLATSAMHVDYGTQARMYALLSVSITAVALSITDLVGRERPGRGAGAALALGAFAAFHAHYFAVQYLGLLTIAALCAAPRRAARLLAPLAAAAALSLPWALTGFRTQLGHDLPPGGDDVGLNALAESFMHLFAHNVSFGGPVLKWFFASAAGLALLLALRGLVLGVRDRATRPVAVVCATCAFVVPLVAWSLAQALPRAGYTWHYVLPSAASAAALAAAGARGRAGRVAVAAALVGTTTLTALHLFRPATEDFRGAVAFLLDEYEGTASEGRAVRAVAVTFQPALFPQGQAYDYYAPRLTPDPPAREPMIEREFDVVRRERLVEADRVLVVQRSLPPSMGLRASLREAFGPPRVEEFGYGLSVLSYERPPGP
ncbi:MAG: glycosyltransferase family 39 protein [Planctomycetota bacterium]